MRKGPEWPKLTPGQKAGAEPQFDPNEKPDKPGISTDPGTSIICLPQRLKEILGQGRRQIRGRKVTSTWRRPGARGAAPITSAAKQWTSACRACARASYWNARALPEVGGNKVYWNGLIHIDTGPRRPW
jgi:hypothetical protein